MILWYRSKIFIYKRESTTYSRFGHARFSSLNTSKIKKKTTSRTNIPIF